MSDCERIAQVAHDKWGTVSDLLRSLMINEPMSESLVLCANCSFALLLTKNEQFTKKLTKIEFFGTFFCKFFFKNERFSHSFFFNEQCEWIAQVAHKKWAKERITHFFAKNEQFAQKADDLIPNPALDAI